MPATAAKYYDMQEVSFTIGIGSLYDDASIGHNLAKLNDAGTGFEWVDPDMVNCEFISVSGAQNAPWFEVKHPGTPNGGLMIECHIGAVQGGLVQVTARITSVYWHSVYGTDHTA